MAKEYQDTAKVPDAAEAAPSARAGTSAQALLGQPQLEWMSGLPTESHAEQRALLEVLARVLPV